MDKLENILKEKGYEPITGYGSVIITYQDGEIKTVRTEVIRKIESKEQRKDKLRSQMNSIIFNKPIED